MKILHVNKYFYPKGGADTNFLDTARVLETKGHKIIYFSMSHEKNPGYEYEKYFISNVDYEKRGIKNGISTSLKLLYSLEARRKLTELISVIKPDIAHLHNIYHQISPSILHTLNKFKIPTVMTLQDYKISCAQYLMLSNEKICEACINNSYYHCFLKRCIKDSRLKSLLNTVEMYLHHKILHIYDLVNVYISPSEFLKQEVEKMGFVGKKIVVLPNIVNVKEYFAIPASSSDSILYFGRLSHEKGLFTLLEAIREIKNIQLKIVGEGPLRTALEARIKEKKIDNVRFMGYKMGDELKKEVQESLFVVVPSEWYENNPRAIIEAFAMGKPVVGARIGGIPELVTEGKTGLLFEAGNVLDLREKIRFLVEHPASMDEMGKNARVFIEKNFDPERHYEKLIEIYELAKELRVSGRAYK